MTRRMVYEVNHHPHPDQPGLREKRAARIRKQVNPELWDRYTWQIGSVEPMGGLIGGIFWVEQSSYSSHNKEENTTYPNKGLAVAAAKKAIRAHNKKNKA